MDTKKQNEKHSVGQGAHKEKYNADDADSYVENPKETSGQKNEEDGNYLDMKWKSISSEFQSRYNIDIKDSEYKKSSFSEIVKKLKKQTGKTSAEIEEQIKGQQKN